MTPRALSLVPAAAVLVACSSSGRPPAPAAPRVPFGQEFTLAVGEAAAVADTGVVLRVESVADDSRCPGDVQCVWEGDAVVHVTAEGPGSVRQPYELHAGRGAREVDHEGLRIRLVRLDPPARSDRTPRPGDYRVTLLVRG